MTGYAVVGSGKVPKYHACGVPGCTGAAVVGSVSKEPR